MPATANLPTLPKIPFLADCPEPSPFLVKSPDPAIAPIPPFLLPEKTKKITYDLSVKL